MSQPTSSKVIPPWWIALLALPLLLALVLSTTQPAPETVKRLADGTEFELAMVAFTNSYKYNQVNMPSWMRPISKLVPDFIGNRLITRGGGIDMGTSPDTNLMVVLDARNSSGNAASVTWLRVSDEAGNRFDGNGVNGVLSSGGQQAMVWRISTLPRRSEKLFLNGLVMLPDGHWTNVGPFEIENPLFKDYPQWRARSVPQTSTNDDVIATLDRLQSGVMLPGGARVDSADGQPEATRVELSFTEAGHPVDHYRIHQLTISDATGNKWSPYLDINGGRAGWTTNGVAEFIGALWPGEDAWKIELQALRSVDFAKAEIWKLPPIPLPNVQMHDDLTNQFQPGDFSVKVANILAPGVEVTNSWQWIVRYWGPERSVYGLGVEFDENMKDRRLVVVKAVDQKGDDFKLVEHRGADYPQQALFLQAPTGAAELHLELAFPELRKFGFLARPEFGDRATSGDTR